MTTSLLVAIKNLVKNPITNLASRYRSVNKMNSMGDSLEFYIKDLLCNSLSEDSLEKKNEIYEKYFSYFGNQNNPPDFIIKNSYAFEVKKIESFNNSLALNSSPPKDRLMSKDIRVNNECRKCDGGDWEEKELFYVIGSVKSGIIKYLFFVHGSCYAANHEIYGRVIKSKKSIYTIGNSKLKTISRFYKLINPLKAFKDILPENKMNVSMLYILMTSNKYNSFPPRDIKELSLNKGAVIKDVVVKNPNGLENFLKAKLIYAIL